jgi:hypothetical protein
MFDEMEQLEEVRERAARRGEQGPHGWRPWTPEEWRQLQAAENALSERQRWRQATG